MTPLQPYIDEDEYEDITSQSSQTIQSTMTNQKSQKSQTNYTVKKSIFVNENLWKKLQIYKAENSKTQNQVIEDMFSEFLK